jgi:hypothetical protein
MDSDVSQELNAFIFRGQEDQGKLLHSVYAAPTTYFIRHFKSSVCAEEY